jgi:hypothetical protein
MCRGTTCVLVPVLVQERRDLGRTNHAHKCLSYREGICRNCRSLSMERKSRLNCTLKQSEPTMPSTMRSRRGPYEMNLARKAGTLPRAIKMLCARDREFTARTVRTSGIVPPCRDSATWDGSPKTRLKFTAAKAHPATLLGLFFTVSVAPQGCCDEYLYIFMYMAQELPRHARVFVAELAIKLGALVSVH